MKKFRIIIALISLVAASACSDLDYVPEYNLATSNFYKTEADLEAAVMGAYKDFTYHICMNHYFYQFLMGDDLSTRPNKDSRITVDQLQPTTGEPDAFGNKTWKQYWEVIYAVNTFMDKYQGASVSDEIKNQKAAQMRFIRAYCYLVLTRNFGSVPLITKIENTGTEKRAKTVELYQFIEEDLKFAEANLKPNWGTDIGRPTTWSAKAGLAYLYMSWAGWPVKDNTKYALAFAAAKDVVKNGPFSLDVDKDGDEDINDFATLWNPDEKWDGNSESVFEFSFSKAELTSGSVMFGAMLAQGMYPEDLVGGTYATGWQDHNAEIGFFKRYPDADPRKELTFLTSWASTDNGGAIVNYDKSRYGKPTYKKWTNIAQKPTPDAFYNGLTRNLSVFRFADILLLYAEAENEVNGPTAEAKAALNRVRKRAGVAEINPAGKTEFTEAVLNERMLELAGEGPRYWDLQRRELLGVFNASSRKEPKDFVAPDPTNPKNWTFPIPESDFRLNPGIVQYFDAATMAK
jgi:starch-binding outer membrane protein, SusD/RagB family